ncbi:MAG TPA: chemotaxis protein CheW [Polyangiaceae bacterium]|nr:chemotaxis protein CheW [Polyangiaceae bacterium]
MDESFSSIDTIAAPANGGEYLTFSVGDEEYACDILSVQEIRAMSQITPIPNAPAYVRGVMNLRGIVVPVISLRAMLGLAGPDDGKFRVIVVVTVGMKIAGLLVDAVSDVLHLDVSEVPLPSELGNRIDVSIVSSLGTLGDKFVVVLDVPRLAERAGLNPPQSS